MLCKYQPGLSNVLHYKKLPIKENFTYEEVLVAMLEEQDPILKNKTITMVKNFSNITPKMKLLGKVKT